MLVMSGNAIGGVHGSWPGLSNEQLFDGADLEVTTDYRRVLSEILIRRMCNNQIGRDLSRIRAAISPWEWWPVRIFLPSTATTSSQMASSRVI